MALLGERDLVRRRFGTPTYVDGRPTTGTPADTTFRGSVQPMNGRDRQVLPEGVRAMDGKKVYCPRGTLRVDDQHAGISADQVLIDSVPYVVFHVDDEHPLIGHDRSYVMRVREGA